ncbi:hypothetical protein HY496_00735 [Candidatus Woesearchaeota archaeon]|nr:hypothetical protein [Candidatus Woesearchaeota archaeon]
MDQLAHYVKRYLYIPLITVATTSVFATIVGFSGENNAPPSLESCCMIEREFEKDILEGQKTYTANLENPCKIYSQIHQILDKAYSVVEYSKTEPIKKALKERR